MHVMCCIARGILSCSAANRATTSSDAVRFECKISLLKLQRHFKPGLEHHLWVAEAALLWWRHRLCRLRLILCIAWSCKLLHILRNASIRRLRRPVVGRQLRAKLSVQYLTTRIIKGSIDTSAAAMLQCMSGRCCALNSC